MYILENEIIKIIQILAFSVFFFPFFCQFAMAQDPGYSESDLFKKGYPRAFFFRSSESMTNIGFDNWDKTFNRLGGIMGKSLNEEIPGRSANIPFFSKFKQEHPEQLVLLHYNGNARDPRDNGEKFHAGHWLYYEGTEPLASIPAESGMTEIVVKDPSIFKIAIGRYNNRNEDVGICRMDSNGNPDWNYAEQVKLISVNLEKGTIKVERGQFGTFPKSFEVGKTLLCPHVHEGPWGENNNLLWLYNHSTMCPKDITGKTCDNILVEEFGEKFSNHGELDLFDGVEFDVLWNEVHFPTFGRKMDVNCDGVGDDGVINGIDIYSVGVFEFCENLREAIGPEKIIMADGMSLRHQRGISFLNGIESEGWPEQRDAEVKDWSGGWNRHLFWNQNGFKPSFSYINVKYFEKLPELPPLGRQRLVWAAAQLLDARITHSGYRNSKMSNNIHLGIIDELVAGKKNKKFWLGKPLEPTIRIALQQPDLLYGAAKVPDKDFLRNFSGENVVLNFESSVIQAEKITEGDMKFSLANIPCKGPDLFISMKIKCHPRKGYPENMPRVLQVSLEDKEKLMSYVNGDWFHATFYFRDVDVNVTSVHFEIESNENVYIKDLTIHAFPDVMYRRFENGIVLANPSHHAFEFDLNKIGQGVNYFHLNGTQDKKINNGKKVGEKLILGEREGLFLETR